MVKKQTNRKNYTVIVLALLLVIVSIASVSTIKVLWDKTGNQAVASVNGDVISKDELYTVLVKQSGEQVLESLISDKVLTLELQDQNMEIADSDVQQEMDKISEQYGGQEAFEQLLAAYGYSLDDVEKDVRNSLIKSKLVEPEISVTEEEMQAYFEENKETLAEEGQTTFEESKEQIKATLLEEKLPTAYETWLQDKYTKYDIKTLL